MELMTDEQIEAAGWKRFIEQEGSRCTYWNPSHGAEIILDEHEDLVEAWCSHGGLYTAFEGDGLEPASEAIERMIASGLMKRLLSNAAAFMAMGATQRAADLFEAALRGEIQAGKPTTY